MQTPVYDLILGNIPGARSVGDPNPAWVSVNSGNREKEVDVKHAGENVNMEVSAVATRAQTLKSGKGKEKLPVLELEQPKTDKQLKCSEEQQKDDTLKGIWKNLHEGQDKVRQTKMGESWYEVKNGILYRMFKKLTAHGLDVKKQVVLPRSRRLTCLKLAHESLMGGHMGVMKTVNKIASQFYWPGIQGDITMFCKSCDICQRTLPKGKVPKVPLDEMPMIDVPFKRVAVDIVGPIYPVSNSGRQYILTMVDYATRYPEAIALSGIDTVQVAEAMLDIYSRVGFSTKSI